MQRRRVGIRTWPDGPGGGSAICTHQSLPEARILRAERRRPEGPDVRERAFALDPASPARFRRCYARATRRESAALV